VSYTSVVQSLFTRLFPVPALLTLPSVGLDFSDTTLRFMKLKQTVRGIVPDIYAHVAIPEGCLERGRIVDETKLTSFLSDVHKAHKLTNVRIALPESQVYSVTLPIDAAVGNDIRASIELLLEDNIPLNVSEAIFDYHVLLSTETTIVVHVVAIARVTAESYLRVFTKAGMNPISFEVDSQAIVRALLPPHSTQSALIVDIGAERTGITIATANTAVYTTSLEFGGSTLVQALMKEQSLDIAAAHQELHQGISPLRKDVFRVLASALSVLRDEIDRRYIYWHERKDELAPLPAIDTVYLCGGYSSIEGLADYLSANLKLRIVHSNPWINCISFDHVIPSLTDEDAQSYVTAIGLALTDYLYD
jgi:type IV pilus assembly protein PilM